MWEKDRLNRKKYADFLRILIKNSDKYKRSEEEESYVIALDSPWGTGKTWFLEMFEKYMEETEAEHGIRIIHYSAWASDFWDNAFLPLMHALYEKDMLKLEALGEDGKDCVRNVLKLAVYLGKEVGLKKVETVFGEEAAEVLKGGIDGLAEHPEQGIRAVFEDYEDFCGAYNTVRKMLEDYQKSLGSNGKIVIVVDELDRCRPDFAVQTLEVVKHLFNMEGLVFLFAVDIRQLGCVIRGIYGEGLDADQYLNRFFHYVTHLPEPDYRKYIRLLYEEKMSNFTSEHQNPEHSTMFANYAGRLAEGFGLSLRELDTIWKNYLVLYDYKLKACVRTEAHLLYLTFLTLKYKMPDAESYMNENGYHAIQDMPQLTEAMRLLPADSPLREALGQKVDLKLNQINGWLYYEYVGIEDRIKGNLRNVSDAGISVGESSYTGGRLYQIQDKTCFAGILYQPDFTVWEQVKDLTLLEYMKEQLEMFAFNGE